MLTHQRTNNENKARELQDVAGEEPADGKPFEVLFANRIPMLNRTVPPFAGKLLIWMIAELIQQIE